MSKDYFQKLKDPKWQKLRLKVLERDEFTCQNCFDSESTLNVHHLFYKKNCDPWDYKEQDLITLCESCHEYETENISNAIHDIGMILKQKGFLSADIHNISLGFLDMKMIYPHDVMGGIIDYILSNEELLRECCSKYFDSLKKKTNA